MKKKEITRRHEKTLIVRDMVFTFIVQLLWCMHLKTLHKSYTFNMFNIFNYIIPYYIKIIYTYVKYCLKYKLNTKYKTNKRKDTQL